MSSISELRFVQAMTQVLNLSSFRRPKHTIVAGAGGAKQKGPTVALIAGATTR
jgi:hypothetical protein